MATSSEHKINKYVHDVIVNLLIRMLVKGVLRFILFHAFLYMNSCNMLGVSVRYFCLSLIIKPRKISISVVIQAPQAMGF